MDDVIRAVSAAIGGPMGFVVGVALTVLVQLVRSRLGGPKPADPTVPPPVLPDDPTAPAMFPRLQRFLKAMYGRKAPAPEDLHPGVVDGLHDEIVRLKSLVSPPPATPPARPGN